MARYNEAEALRQLIDPSRDQIYGYDAEKERIKLEKATAASFDKPYTDVYISSVAAAKMVLHAEEGDIFEVMGIMQGYTTEDAFVITDAFRLPVQGTETRVNASADADEYLLHYLSGCQTNSQLENAVGWYHSHPGYGCWLSGIDVETQMYSQRGGPWVAVVVDPFQTLSTGKVSIGAFRTHPDSVVRQKATASGTPNAPNSRISEPENLPSFKETDFGRHASKYYPLTVHYYKSSLDTALLSAIQDRNWVQTLSSNPLFLNQSYHNRNLNELGERLIATTDPLLNPPIPGLTTGKKSATAAAAAAAASAPAPLSLHPRSKLSTIVRKADILAAEARDLDRAMKLRNRLFGQSCGTIAEDAAKGGKSL